MIFRIHSCLLVEAGVTGMDKYSSAKDESVDNLFYSTIKLNQNLFQLVHHVCI